MKYQNQLITTILCGSLLCLAQAGTALGQNYNEDEWYDPTDWFDGNNYEYDDNLDLDYGRDAYGTGLYGYEDYEYDYDYGFDEDYLYDSNDWRDYDYDYRFYDDLSYGWHYQWDPTQSRWVREFGYYDDYYDYNPQPTRREMNQTLRQAPQQGNQRVVRGQIDYVRPLNLTDPSGNIARHSAAQVRFEDGRWVTVDLGRDQRNLRASLNKGDRIVVRGQRGQINGRQVLMANQIQINGRNYQLSRSAQRQVQQQPRQQPPQASNWQSQLTKFITGRVIIARPVRFGTFPDRNYVQLQLSNGQTIMVDLGTRISLEDLDINRDDLVTVYGRTVVSDGTRIFRANSIWVNGEQFKTSQNMAQR